MCSNVFALVAMHHTQHDNAACTVMWGMHGITTHSHFKMFMSAH